MNKKWIRAAIIAAILPLLLSDHAYAVKGVPEEETPQEEKIEPWFTGPLLTSSGHVIPVGYINIEPYIFATDTIGQYNTNWSRSSTPSFWTVNPLLSIQVGIAPRVDFEIAPQLLWNTTQGHSAVNVGDFPMGFAFQILEETETDWWPAIKFTIAEQFPTGKYQHLDPHKQGTDATGTGAFVTAARLTFAKLYHIKKRRYFNTRYALTYSMPSRVHVKGFNTYGGSYNTNGYIYTGYSLTAGIGLEYSLTRNWVLALDIQNIYTNKTRFKGNPGRQERTDATITNPAGGLSGTVSNSDNTLGGPYSNQLSLAPAIEYNFSDSFGIIAGCWFTVAGRNTSQFVSGVIAFNWFLPFRKQVDTVD